MWLFTRYGFFSAACALKKNGEIDGIKQHAGQFLTPCGCLGGLEEKTLCSHGAVLQSSRRRRARNHPTKIVSKEDRERVTLSYG